MLQLELLHHYTTSTCLTLSKDPLRQTIWRLNVVQIGFSSPFVMRAILAMAAYHRAYFRPSQRGFYVSQAAMHHQTALQSVASVIPQISEQNCTAVWIFSALTCLISCAKPRQPEDFLFIEANGVSEWLQMFRGTRTILNHASDLLQAGPLGPMLVLGQQRVQRRESLQPRHPDFLQQLRRLIITTTTDPSTLEVYDGAIDELAKSFVIINDVEIRDFESSDILVWLFDVSEEYLALLSEKSPEALAIFAHFCVVLKELEWAWWMDGWSLQLLSNVYHSLDHNYRLWIQWPIEQLGWVPT